MQPDEQERQDAGDHPSSCIEQSPPVQDTADAVHGADHDSSKTNKVGDVHGPGDWQEAQETDRLQSKEPSGPGLESGNVQNETTTTEAIKADKPSGASEHPLAQANIEESNAVVENSEKRPEVSTAGAIADTSSNLSQIYKARNDHNLRVMAEQTTESRDSDSGHQNPHRVSKELAQHSMSNWQTCNTGDHVLSARDAGRTQISPAGTNAQTAAQNHLEASFQHHGPQQLVYPPAQLQQAHVTPDMQIPHIQPMAPTHRASRPSPIPVWMPRPLPAARALHATQPAGQQIYPRQHSQPSGTIRNAPGGPGHIHYTISQAQQMVANLPSYSHPFGFAAMPGKSFPPDRPSQLSAVTPQAMIQSHFMGGNLGPYVPLHYPNFMYPFAHNRVAMGHPYQPNQTQGQPGARVANTVRRSPVPSRTDSQPPLQHTIPHGRGFQLAPSQNGAFVPSGKTGASAQVLSRAAGATSMPPNQLPISQPDNARSVPLSASVGQKGNNEISSFNSKAPYKSHGHSMIHPLTVTSDHTGEHDFPSEIQSIGTSRQSSARGQGLIPSNPALVTSGQDCMASASAPFSSSEHPVQSQQDSDPSGKVLEAMKIGRNPLLSSKDSGKETETNQCTESEGGKQGVPKRSDIVPHPGRHPLEGLTSLRRGPAKAAPSIGLSPDGGHADPEGGVGVDFKTVNIVEKKSGACSDPRQPGTSDSIPGVSVSPNVDNGNPNKCETENIADQVPGCEEGTVQGLSSELFIVSSAPFTSQQDLTDNQREDQYAMYENGRDPNPRSGSELGVSGSRQELNSDALSERFNERKSQSPEKDRQESKVPGTNNMVIEETMGEPMHQLFDSKMCIMGLPTSAKSKARCSKLMTLDLPQDGTMLCSVDPLVGTTLILCCLGDDDTQQSAKKSLEGLGPVTTVPIALEDDEVLANGYQNGLGSGPSSSNTSASLEGGSPRPDFPTEINMAAVQAPRGRIEGDANGETTLEAAYSPEPPTMDVMEDIQVEEVDTNIDKERVEDTADRQARKRQRVDEVHWVVDGSNSQETDEYSADGESSGMQDLVRKEVQPESITSGLPYSVGQLLHSNQHNPANKEEFLEGLVDVPVEEVDAADIIPDQPKPCPIQVHDFDTTIVCSLRASKRQELDTVFMSTPELQGTGSTVCAVVGFDYEDSATLCWTGVDREPSRSKDAPCHQLGTSSLVSVPIVPDVETR